MTIFVGASLGIINYDANYTAFCLEGLIVARLKGNIVRVGKDLGVQGKDQTSHLVNTVIGNKQHPADATGLHDEVTLKTSTQVIPLVQFPSSLTAENGGNLFFIARNCHSAEVDKYVEITTRDLVYQTRDLMQAIIDEFFNSDCEHKVPTAATAILAPPTSIGATISSQVPANRGVTISSNLPSVPATVAAMTAPTLATSVAVTVATPQTTATLIPASVPAVNTASTKASKSAATSATNAVAVSPRYHIAAAVFIASLSVTAITAPQKSLAVSAPIAILAWRRVDIRDDSNHLLILALLMFKETYIMEASIVIAVIEIIFYVSELLTRVAPAIRNAIDFIRRTPSASKAAATFVLPQLAAGPASVAYAYLFLLWLSMLMRISLMESFTFFFVVEIIVYLYVYRLDTQIPSIGRQPTNAATSTIVSATNTATAVALPQPAMQPTLATAAGTRTAPASSAQAASSASVRSVPAPNPICGVINYRAPWCLRNASTRHWQLVTAQEVGDRGKEECSICLCPLVGRNRKMGHNGAATSALPIGNQKKRLVKLHGNKGHNAAATSALPFGNQEKRLVKLPCGHLFHLGCITEALVKVGAICPYCRQAICEPQGKSPSGTMSTRRNANSFCAGYDQNSSSGIVVIEYNIPRGKQLSYHCNPGTQHSGASRSCYLPNDAEGRALLKRLQYAFEHGLTFTVGTSMTSGQANQVTWASIPHKTSWAGSAATYGFPDPSYFAICNAELDSLGVPRADDL